MRPIQSGPSIRSSSIIGDLRAGFAEAVRHRWLLLITGQFALLGLLVFAPFAILGPQIFATRKNGAISWGIVAAAGGLGGVVGGVLAGGRRLKNPLLVFEMGVGFLSLPIIILASGGPLIFLIMGSLAAGSSTAVMNVILTTAMQEAIPSHLLSRVSASLSFVVLIGATLGFSICGAISHTFGVDAMMTAGPALVAFSVLSVICSKSIRKFQFIN
jgi:MFS family permease